MLSREQAIALSQENNLFGEKAVNFVTNVRKELKGNPLSDDIAFYMYQIYFNIAPAWFQDAFTKKKIPSKEIYSIEGTQISHKGTKLLITDFGPYIELEEKQPKLDWIPTKGEEWRFSPKYSKVGYQTYSLICDPIIKIHYQRYQSPNTNFEAQKFYLLAIDVFPS